MSYIMRWTGKDGKEWKSVPYKDALSVNLAAMFAGALIQAPIEIDYILTEEDARSKEWCDLHHQVCDEMGYCESCQSEPQGDGDED